MTYICENCRFLFFRTGEANECPYCEKKHIRLATVEEKQNLKEILDKKSSYAAASL